MTAQRSRMGGAGWVGEATIPVNALLKINNLSDVLDIGTARSNIGALAAAGGACGPLQFTSPASTTDVLLLDVTGDAQRRFVVNADGALEWGSGAGARDTNLYRSTADVLRTDDLFAAPSIALGASPAAAGVVRLPNNSAITARNALGNGDVDVVKLTSANTVGLGAAVASFTMAENTTITLGTGTGTILGSTAADKLALWGKPAVTQATTAIAPAAFVAGTGEVMNANSTFGGYTVAQAIAALIRSGVLA